MAHTFVNIDPKGFIHVLGRTYIIAGGDSIVLEAWQLIQQDVDDIANGFFSVTPPLPEDLTGIGLRMPIPPNDDLGLVLDEVIYKLRRTAPTQDQKDALDGATGANALNPFATIADVSIAALTPVQETLAVVTLGQTVFTLSDTPVSPLTDLHVGHILQKSIIDYTVSGTTLTWLDTDFILEPGDHVSISYFK